MAERETLLSTLPEAVRDDAERLYDEQADPHGIVAELHRRGLLRDEQVREAVLALERSLRVGRMRSRPPASGEPAILGPLGAGAMGEVLLAKDEGLNRVVAVKRLHPELASRPAVLQRFYKEAQVTAQLDHPSIVPIHGLVAAADGSLAYTMKLVRGRTLEDYLEEARELWRRQGREDAEHALPARLEVFLHVCDAIGYAHERGVLHRDLKPENVMVGTFGQVMVMDWGIAKLLDQAEAEAPAAQDEGGSTRKVHGTRVGAVIGTPRYMSPEQAEGRNDILDPRSDQYSLGLILFEVTTLRAAVSAELDLDGCLEWAKAGRKQPMKHLHRKGTVPRELQAIVDKATQRDRERRYRSVADLATDVRRYLRDESVLAKPDTLSQRVLRFVGRHRQLMVSSLFAMALLLVLAVTSLTALGLGAIEWRRRAAQAHEEALARLLATTAAQAREVDGAALAIEGLLTGLTFAGEGSLDRPEADLQLSFDPLVEPPPKLKPSQFYNRPVSVDRPSFVVADGVDPEGIRDHIERLAAIAYQYTRVLVDSTGRVSDERLTRGKRHEIVSRGGAPVVWAKVATREGVLATVPGTSALQPGPDPRKLPWYTAPDQGQGVAPTWTGPSIDPAGMGAVVTVSLPLWDHRQELLGVAAADVGLDALSRKLDPPPGITDAFLVDAQGQKVVWRGMNARSMKSWSPPAVDADLKAAMRASPQGWREADGTITTWTPVPALGWTFVLVAPDVF